MNDHEELKGWVLKHMGWCPEVLSEEEAKEVRKLMKKSDEVKDAD